MLSALEKANIYLKAKKCHVAMEELVYLGHLVGHVCISQQDDKGRWYAIGYDSRATTAAESKWSIPELECLTLIWATKKHRHLVDGSTFEVQAMRMTIKYVKGNKNPADAMTRLRDDAGRYFWPGMKEDVRAWVAACEVCSATNSGVSRAAGHLQHVMVEQQPAFTISADFTPTKTADGLSHVLTVVDLDTRFAWAHPCHGENSEELVSFLDYTFRFGVGCPRRMISDNGSAFTCAKTQDYLKGVGIKHDTSTPGHPQSNGTAERFNRTITDKLRAGAHDAVLRQQFTSAGAMGRTTWPALLRAICYAYNTTEHPATGYSPYFLMFGRDPPSTLEGRLRPEHTNGVTVDEFVAARDEALHEARKRKIAIESAFREGMKRYYDGGRYEPGIGVGDVVWKARDATLRHLKVHTNEVKMEPLWDGPFTVAKWRANVVQLRDVEGVCDGKYYNITRIRKEPSASATAADRVMSYKATDPPTAGAGGAEPSPMADARVVQAFADGATGHHR
eukprot:m51a1_g11472 hypothetical protein (506) ;mRNA; r:3101-5359